MPDAFSYLPSSKLCWHSWPGPTTQSLISLMVPMYIVKFPWKPYLPLLINKSPCGRWVQSLTQKLSKMPEILKVYSGIIEEQLRHAWVY